MLHHVAHLSQDLNNVIHKHDIRNQLAVVLLQQLVLGSGHTGTQPKFWQVSIFLGDHSIEKINFHIFNDTALYTSIVFLLRKIKSEDASPSAMIFSKTGQRNFPPLMIIDPS